MAKFIFDRVENIAGKGENAGYQHFLLFPECFQMLIIKNLSKFEEISSVLRDTVNCQKFIA